MGIFIRFFLYALLLLPAFRVGAQALDAAYLQSNFQLHITKTSGPITLDGEFNEPVWKEAESAGSFHKKYPTDVGSPKKKTNVQVCYDSKFIYFAITAWDSGKALIQSLKRDMGHDGNDGVGITLDPGNEKTVLVTKPLPSTALKTTFPPESATCSVVPDPCKTILPRYTVFPDR